MGDPIENPDVYWITRHHRHIPISRTTGKVAFREGGPPTREDADVAAPAKMTHAEAGLRTPRMTKEKRAISAVIQRQVAELVGGEVVPDNDAFDVVTPHSVIEVKSLIEAQNDRLNMGTSSRIRKQIADSRKYHFTLGVDVRAQITGTGSKIKMGEGPRAYYLFMGTGAFRLGRILPTAEGVLREIFRSGKY